MPDILNAPDNLTARARFSRNIERSAEVMALRLSTKQARVGLILKPVVMHDKHDPA